MDQSTIDALMADDDWKQRFPNGHARRAAITSHLKREAGEEAPPTAMSLTSVKEREEAPPTAMSVSPVKEPELTEEADDDGGAEGSD